jgi:hypothetical protein
MKRRATRSSADRPAGGSGRAYHLDVGPGDVAPCILLVGDPARAEKVARRFERVEVERRHREFVTLTGPYRGAPLTVTATGIGADNTEGARRASTSGRPSRSLRRDRGARSQRAAGGRHRGSGGSSGRLPFR